MKLILLQDVPNLGKRNETVVVKDGYGRNFLIPRKLAILATPANLRGLKSNEQRFSQKTKKVHAMSLSLAERLNQIALKTTIKVGIDGKSFGSITTHDIAELLGKEGIELDKKHIVLEEPIKHPGVYDINVHLPEKVTAAFKIAVVPEEGA